MAENGHVQGINPFLEEISDNLSSFIENINCLHETYKYSEVTLRLQKHDADKQYEDLIKTFPRNHETEELGIPRRHYRDYLRKYKRKKRAERAMVLVPPSYLVSLVSLYDQFYAGMVRLVYRISPERLKESQKTFSYRDICDYMSVQEVKIQIIDETIESLLHGSHIEQFNWLEKAMEVSTLKKFDEWSAFVELTERRNLFVHSDGVVSQQYIDNCRKYNALPIGVQKRTQLVVDSEYFEQAYQVLYIIGIKLTQMFAHTIYNKQYPNDESNIDMILISNVYDALTDELYKVAISVSEFALANSHFIHSANDRGYIVLNLAQAYKWRGDVDKCMELLKKEDCTAWKDELLIPKYTLENNFEMVYEKMQLVGSTSEILTPENYRQWPIFKEIRREHTFCKLFAQIFNENLEVNIAFKIDDEERTETTTVTVNNTTS